MYGYSFWTIFVVTAKLSAYFCGNNTKITKISNHFLISI